MALTEAEELELLELEEAEYQASKKKSVVDKPSILESAGEGFFDGLSLGFRDELGGGLEAAGRAVGIKGLGGNFNELGLDKPVGLNKEELEKIYTEKRDDRRRVSEDAAKENPITYGAAGVAGGVGSSVAMPSSAATLAGRMAQGAGLGSIAGYGMSNAKAGSDELLGDMAQSAAIGAATVPVVEKVIAPAIGKGIDAASKIKDYLTKKYGPNPIAKGISKLGSVATGMDDEALLRNYQRPKQMAKAEGENFAYDLSRKAMNELDETGRILGKDVDEAKTAFLKTEGLAPVNGVGDNLANQVDEFLTRHEMSHKGFSGLSEKQTKELTEMAANLRGDEMNGTDLVNFRDYLDHVEKLNMRYDKEGTGLYSGFLKNLRHNADKALDQVSKSIDSANTQYSNFLKDKKMLGLNNENTAESVVNNLYGANKLGKQKAAENIFSYPVLDGLKDIAANKASKVQGPSGSDMGKRTAASIGVAMIDKTLGLGTLGLTSPTVWKHGARMSGNVGEFITQNAHRFGKYSQPLMDAIKRGPAAVSSTIFLLQQSNPEFRQMLNGIEEEDGK